MAKKKKLQIKPVICPYCGRTAQLRPTSYVYGEDNLNPDGYLYVCSGYPKCDAYVGAHEKDRSPKGTLANSELRNKRIQAHRALDAIWQQGYMTRKSTYIWLQNRLNLRECDMHIGKFSEYRCNEIIQECTEFLEMRQKQQKEGGNRARRKQLTA